MRTHRLPKFATSPVQIHRPMTNNAVLVADVNAMQKSTS